MKLLLKVYDNNGEIVFENLSPQNIMVTPNRDNIDLNIHFELCLNGNNVKEKDDE